MIVCRQGAVALALATLIMPAVAGYSASAQDTIMQSQTGFYVQTSAGQPTVCGIEFSLLYQDRTYRQAAIAGLKGTLGWVESNGQLGVILKVGGFDFPNATAAPQAFRVTHAFLSAGNKPFPPHTIIPCDGQPMGFCGTYWMQAPADLYQASIANTLSIKFQRQPNGLDVSLPIDTRSAATAKPQDYGDFSTCIVAITDRTRRRPVR